MILSISTSASIEITATGVSAFGICNKPNHLPIDYQGYWRWCLSNSAVNQHYDKIGQALAAM